MITAWLMIAVQLPAPPPPALPPAAATTPMPSNWAALPLFPRPLRTDGFHVSAFVQSEVAAGRCRVEPDAAGVSRLDVPVAILVGAGGVIRQVVPQAIDCPTVEQFTVGFVSTLARGATVADHERLRAGWYRLPVTYQWQG
ncbi:hypothetical protein ACT009_00695 [Sphingomonas sp. Tas61C01]|uniref:hypothetical protein n=1 Tax=Sphingomonas sp. Tas61C01 TaxID=3458297 RepID=UPI00403ED71F